MSEQSKRLQKQKEEDAAFNKMLIWLAGAIAVEGVSLLLRAFYLYLTYMAGGLEAFFKVYRFLGAAVFAAGCVWSLTAVHKGEKVTRPLACTGGALWLWAAAVLCYGVNYTGMKVLCVLPAVVAGLAAIYFLYQREFFASSVLVAMGITALWVFRQFYMEHPRTIYVGFAAVCVVMAAAALAGRYLSQHGGKLGRGRVLSPDAGYLPIYLTCAAVVAGLVCALLLGVGAAYYIVAVLVGWLFCLAVYYTVKLM